MKLFVPLFVLTLTLTLTAGAQPRAYMDRFVSVSGLRLHYLDWGNADKPPLIMLHGIGRDAHSFDHIAPRFSRDYHVIAVDLRGHGDSAWHPDGAYLVEDFVKDLEGLVDQHGLPDLVLLGNSTGGRVAQVYAGLHPDRVRALVVEDVGPERPQDVASGFARRVQQDADGWGSEDELVAHLRTQDARTSEDLLRAHARSATKRRDDGRLVWKRDPNLVKGFVPTELWTYVRRIASPTLYVLGGRSAIVSVETQHQLKTTIPGCEITVMPEVGHYPHLEAPTEYLELVAEFLTRRAAGQFLQAPAPSVLGFGARPSLQSGSTSRQPESRHPRRATRQARAAIRAPNPWRPPSRGRPNPRGVTS